MINTDSYSLGSQITEQIINPKREKSQWNEINYNLLIPDRGCDKFTKCRTCTFPIEKCPFHVTDIYNAFPCLEFLTITEKKYLLNKYF